MSFNIALSGLNAAQKDLDVTSNNIANVNTTGFKESRAEFVDVYASSLLASGKTKVGDGVLTADVAQQFSQGSIQFTNNALDLAITGNGFYATVPEIDSLETSYTRAGQFKLNDSNFVVNSGGGYLLGFPVNADGSSSSVSLSTAEPILIPTSSGAPTPSSKVDIRMNLPAGDSYITGAPGNFDPKDSGTFNHSTSVTTFDSLGDSHIMTYYFVKDNPSTNPNEWMMFAGVDGVPVNIVDPVGGSTNPVGGTVSGGLFPGGVVGARLEFSSSGDFVNQIPTPAEGGIVTEPLGGIILSNGAEASQTIEVDFNLDVLGPNPNEPTQFASNFEVTALEQDGLAVGRLTGIDIGTDGLIRATYSNGTSAPLSRISLVNFANEQGLTQIGNSSWKESISSGEALAGEAGSGTFGTINSSALEQSNVNLTTELIDLISAQRNFQANSRALEVDNQLNQTILQIR
ncbi:MULTISPECIES: flagellar hook protein FlgE [unclassified Colwellia]|uniref:flagellar hook protein FlgE n=1 Tax=unclassified Colwellia TaxID=196834 RepID=UPI0015F43E3B|nr:MULTISPECIES: flagellar hook protein FlgE [unclassified Colwellia]MBA6233381.1 flagellar hook protein FlgE [Colwellia sp. MB02u-7]MBA6236471.1 flagellar hook protein FlgE [Colwellia sp. MB02u-11]MBA6257005.1 flagellar hook protein FlgE [Colwellia sp. MB3u-28]MBA6260990.1 flagellar hook protein FlgE [Colwellia sp. MB3u-41]MBA6298130.1 flagellar hook protein FlgE [Colwellia sp. MB3u-22]